MLHVFFKSQFIVYIFLKFVKEIVKENYKFQYLPLYVRRYTKVSL